MHGWILLWALAPWTARGVAAAPELGPRITEVCRGASIAVSRTIERIVDQYDLAFDIRVVAVADEAVEDLCVAAGIPYPPSAENVLKAGQVAAVNRLLVHVLAAGHAEDEIRSTLFARFGGEVGAMKAVQKQPEAAGDLMTSFHEQGVVISAHVKSLTPTTTTLVTSFKARSPQNGAVIRSDPPGWIVLSILDSDETFLLVVGQPGSVYPMLPEDPERSGAGGARSGARFFFCTPRRLAKRSGEPVRRQ